MKKEPFRSGDDPQEFSNRSCTDSRV